MVFSICRKHVAEAFGFKISAVYFSSDLAARSADKAGFIHEGSLTWDELEKIDPELSFPNIESSCYQLKTLIF